MQSSPFSSSSRLSLCLFISLSEILSSLEIRNKYWNTRGCNPQQSLGSCCVLVSRKAFTPSSQRLKYMKSQILVLLWVSIAKGNTAVVGHFLLLLFFFLMKILLQIYLLSQLWSASCVQRPVEAGRGLFLSSRSSFAMRDLFWAGT